MAKVKRKPAKKPPDDEPVVQEEEELPKSEDEDAVGIMSDTDDSDDTDSNTECDETELPERAEDLLSFKLNEMPDLPEHGITIGLGKSARRGKRGPRNGDSDEDSDDEAVKAKRKRFDLNEMVRKSINKTKITEQLMKHKMSLLLYIARGLRLVKIANCNVIRGLSMSIVESKFKFKTRPKLKDRAFVSSFMEQFNKVILITDDDDKRSKHMQQPFMVNLLDCYSSLETTSLIELVVIFVACLKAAKPLMPVRIVNVLRPITLEADIIPKPDAKSSKKPAKSTKKSTKQIPDFSNDVVEKLDYWVEVYLSEEKKWCCVDLCSAKLDDPTVLTELSRPFQYLVSYDVDRYCVKPAEKNYCENWYTPAFKKGRCDEKWWDKVMNLLGPDEKNDEDEADENKTEEILTKQDMPTSDSGFRNHPLYVLEKHLLKFQGIYPAEVPPMGYFKDQPVYPRDCVHTLRSRETWLRQARTVKLGETPYKIVKARPKKDRNSGDLVRDLPLEVFGEWQTEQYDPPSAENGKVPRNCYGNVDMYQECMLPKGCAWLKLPGLLRVANKLGIDCAAAVVGFDNHCGSYGAHPVIDGFIVCEEFTETLQMAWEEEQENSRQREEAKRQKRIWDNWKKLLKAAIIREKLRVKYNT